MTKKDNIHVLERQRFSLPPFLTPIQLVPNCITILGMCAGFLSLHFCFGGEFEKAILAIIVACVIDACDGYVARLVKGTSKFGEQLDSLADFLNFGMAPALMIHIWAFNGLAVGFERRFGEIAILCYIVSCALRLARFNTELTRRKEQPAWQRNYYMGTPSPFAALIVMFPLYCAFMGLDFFRYLPFFLPAYVIVVALLMIAPVPNYDLRKIILPISADMILPTLLLVSLGGAFLVIFPWLSLMAVVVVYLTFLPVHFRNYHQRAKEEAALARKKKQAS